MITNPEMNQINGALMKLVTQVAKVETKLEAIDEGLNRRYDEHKNLESRVTDLEAKENRRAGIIIAVSTGSALLATYAPQIVGIV